MTPAEAIARAERGELLPVYLFLGEERLLRDQALAVISKTAIGGGLADFNVDKFTAGEADVERVLAATRTVPMMGNKRLVLVRSLERWDGAGEAEALDRLNEYAKEPIDSTCLVLVGGKINGRRKLVGAAKKAGYVVDCAPLDGRALPGWLRERAKTKGHTLAPDVAELIAEISGPDLSTLADVVERLSLYVGEKAEIDEEAVSACVTRVRLADTWKLVDAAGAKDLGAVLALFADVYDPRDRGLPLIGAVAWSLRQLLKLEAALGQGASLDEAARRAGIYPTFRAKEHAQKLKAFRPRELEKWLLIVQETDAALKSSRRSADAILEGNVHALVPARGLMRRAFVSTLAVAGVLLACFPSLDHLEHEPASFAPTDEGGTDASVDATDEGAKPCLSPASVQAPAELVGQAKFCDLDKMLAIDGDTGGIFRDTSTVTVDADSIHTVTSCAAFDFVTRVVPLSLEVHAKASQKTCTHQCNATLPAGDGCNTGDFVWVFVGPTLNVKDAKFVTELTLQAPMHDVETLPYVNPFPAVDVRYVFLCRGNGGEARDDIEIDGIRLCPR